MERYEQDNYYHGGVGEENRRYQSHGQNYHNDFGRGYDRRPDNYFNGRSIEERRQDMSQYDNHARLRSGNHDFDNEAYSNFQRNNQQLRNAYDNQVRREHHQLDDIRQGYGVPEFGNKSGSGYQQEQGYNSGRMSGYSGAAFGGSNYSAHGGFGGAPEYGAMSGDRGNVTQYTSASGYGGGENRNAYGQAIRQPDSDNYRNQEQQSRYRRNDEHNR